MKIIKILSLLLIALSAACTSSLSRPEPLVLERHGYQATEGHMRLGGLCHTSGPRSLIYLSWEKDHNIATPTSDPYVFESEIYASWAMDTRCKLTNVTDNDVRLKVTSYVGNREDKTQYIDIPARCMDKVFFDKDTDKLVIELE